MKTAAILIVSSLLGACGGGGDSAGSQPATLLDETTSVSGAPSDGLPRSQWSVGVDGPTFSSRPGSIQACASGQWVQQIAADTVILSDVEIQLPSAQPAQGTSSTAATAGAALTIPFSRCVRYAANSSGTAATRLLFSVRSGGGASNALGSYVATIRWVVTVE